MKSKWLKLACLGLVAAMVLPFASACGGEDLNNEDRALKLSSGEFDGVFNPFFATSAYDSTIVGQTQISLLGSDDNGENVTYGPDEPVVALDYQEIMRTANGSITTNGSAAAETVYQIVLKNGIKFSDGVELTAHDVLFNLYMYLDPNYTGSNTLYSTDIQGLQAYMAQDPNADEDALNSLNQTFTTLGERRSTAIERYVSTNFSDTQKQDAIDAYNEDRLRLFESYDEDNGTDLASSYENYTESDIAEDIAAIREQFRTDLTSTYNAIDMTSYESEYALDSSKIWQGFFLETGVIERKYTTVAGVPVYEKDSDGKFVINWEQAGISSTDDFTQEEAIERAYQTFASNDSQIASILTDWSTGTTMRSTFAAEDREMYFNAIREEEGGLAVRSISGIEVLDASEFEGGSYAEGEYEMLQITINGIDPKAKWNFAITVAPMHYYSTPELTAAAMADDDYSENFGVEYSSNTFMNYVRSRNSVPVGAGVYQASTINDDIFVWETDESGNQTQASQNSLNTVSSGFRSNGIVYLIRNDNFVTTGGNEEEVYNARIKHLQYQVISTTNMMASLVNETVDIADPSAKQENVSEVDSTEHLTSIQVQTNGYGYIGINAKFVPNLYVRRALMSVMDVTLVQEYYPNELSFPIYRSFSTTSWVYNAFPSAGLEHWDPESRYPYDSTGLKAAELLRQGGCRQLSDGSWVDDENNPLEFTFTIAGDSTDHPANLTFLNAISVLDKIGIEATLVTDARALYKLASGGLAIWAAAWTSTVDPDMYQVYHKNSRATSVLNWGYDYLVTEGNATTDEMNIINDLSDLIDEGREYLDQASRAGIYREAADMVMELAVELPLYQRCDMYVYNNQVIDAASLFQEPSPYMSPISEIWKVSYLGN